MIRPPAGVGDQGPQATSATRRGTPARPEAALTAYEQAMFVRGATAAGLVLCSGEEAPQSLVDMFAGAE